MTVNRCASKASVISYSVSSDDAMQMHWVSQVFLIKAGDATGLHFRIRHFTSFSIGMALLMRSKLVCPTGLCTVSRAALQVPVNWRRGQSSALAGENRVLYWWEDALLGASPAPRCRPSRGGTFSLQSVHTIRARGRCQGHLPGGTAAPCHKHFMHHLWQGTSTLVAGIWTTHLSSCAKARRPSNTVLTPSTPQRASLVTHPLGMTELAGSSRQTTLLNDFQHSAGIMDLSSALDCLTTKHAWH